MTTNLGSIISKSGDRSDNEIVLIDLINGAAPREYSIAEFDLLINTAASIVQENTLEQGARVGIIGQNSAHYLAAIFGIMRAGRVVVPINGKFSSEAFKYICDDAELSLIFSDESHDHTISTGIMTISLDANTFSTFPTKTCNEIFEPSHGTPALILYTSGSTGQPKGVILSHDSQLSMVKRFGALLKNLTGVVAAPLFHMNGILFSSVLLSQRSTIVLMPSFDAVKYLHAIERYQANLITGVPTMLSLLGQQSELVSMLDLSSVGSVNVGSAPLTQTVTEQSRVIFPNAQITNSYGTTEAGSGMFGPHPEGIPIPTLSLGHVGDHVEVRLVGDSDPNVGELEVKTPAVMNGYLNLPEKTAEILLDDGWIKTGDIMRRDRHGFFYFEGRVDDMFVCSGENIYPGQIERILEKSPKVSQVCVVPLADEIKGQIPVAYVVLSPNARLSEQQVKEIALTGLPPFMHPRHVYFLDSMPLASTNKVDRNELMIRAIKALGKWK